MQILEEFIELFQFRQLGLKHLTISTRFTHQSKGFNGIRPTCRRPMVNAHTRAATAQFDSDGSADPLGRTRYKC